jgi:hypothetical protein
MEGSLIFSPDGKRLAYAAKNATNWLVVVDGKPGPDRGRILKGSLIFSPDGKRPAGDVPGGRVAYAAWKGYKWIVVVDGNAGPEYSSTPGAIFSPDGKRVAYKAQKGKKWLVLVDGKPGPEYDRTSHPMFSPDSKRVAYEARKGKKSFVVLDGRPGPEYDDIIGGKTVFSPDKKHTFYLAQVGMLAQEGMPAQERMMLLAILVLSRHGKPGPENEWIVGGATFHADGVLEYLAVKKKTLYRVKHVPAAK